MTWSCARRVREETERATAGAPKRLDIRPFKRVGSLGDRNGPAHVQSSSMVMRCVCVESGCFLVNSLDGGMIMQAKWGNKG